ncbi:MAG: DNA replication/repair protein RecF [Alphaproteobacteria bacterium]|nr:MAG: DNA replication/repair protein RecF [Alphaproteobacteria bacterium]
MAMLQENVAHVLPEGQYPLSDHSSSQYLSQAITELKLLNFRSYDTLSIRIPGASAVLVGPNGSGKTNILEAISWLSPGRGLRRSTLMDPYAQNKSTSGSLEGWGVHATVLSKGIVTKLGSGISHRQSACGTGVFRRMASVDGSYVRSISQLNEYLTVQWVTPHMDRILGEGLTDRRQFLDRMIYVFDTHHATRLAQYDAALRERMKLLRLGRTDDLWLTSLEEKIATLSLSLGVARIEFVARIHEMNCWQMSSFPRAILFVEGEIEDMLDAGHSATFIEEHLRGLLRRARDLDARTGVSHHGAHRSNLRVIHAEKNIPATQCSTGEQKAMLLSIVIANTRVLLAQNKPVPVLLFDEVIAHLDATRRAELFAEIDRLGVQVWMTGTDISVFEHAKCIAHFITTGATN